MSIIAISDTAGSLGTEIGRGLASKLGYEFADRELISKAAERFGEAPTDLTHATEEKPTLWERVRETQHRYTAYVEAIMFEMAAADGAVLIGRGAAIVLGKFPHVLRVRVTAPPAVRARRIQETQGLTAEAAEDEVRRSDREHGTRLKFLYHVDWDDPLLYDLVLNTDRVHVGGAVHLIGEALRDERFRLTPAAQRAITDANVVVQAKVVLMRHPLTSARQIFVACLDGAVSLTGTVETDAERTAAEAEVARLPGVKRVMNELIALDRVRRGLGGA